MSTNLVATASVVVGADRGEVWRALVDPSAIKQYFFGTTVSSDWNPGSPITWTGEWKGESYEDKGTILTFDPEERLAYTHYSPMSGQADLSENYHTVSIELAKANEGTQITLTQDGNASDEEREHSEKNWEMVLGGLKQYVEG